MAPDSAADSPSGTLRILVADDHPMVREGARLMIGNVPGWEVCGVAEDGREVIAQALRLRPDVIVLDLHMPELDGLAAVRDIRKQLPATELVIFSGVRNEGLIEQLFEAGARSFIGKAEAGEALIAAIRSAAEHKPFFTPQVSQILFGRFMGDVRQGAPKAAAVTKREREIIRHIADGRSNKEVAAALGISSRTAETHRAAIMRKLGASSTAEIVRYAIRNGIIEA
ncbi:MAG: two component transcriptional regulator, LuxR family [uncultured Chthoniobacterales bacterium]|uniref:Two component transcriptional regulator, LuxR family n=1 Tax=uncultured Chthoniobacterales bacterium TaxID=1836801 RepID=A0A6J4HZT6_9BACT|nr:MAG: two component transcriptional regulator, LuxR family [uncultured Chthoniobacterales bacterium]